MAKVGFILVVYVVAVVLLSTAVHGQGTRLGFYRATCPQVESIVRSTVQSHFRMDPSIAPGLLRMHSHDCFVRGCDASVLLAGPNSERTAVPNRTLKGFEVIDDAKSQLEDVCPGVVSCADILALAARDSVVLTGGRSWEVPTGRRDGRVSLVSEVKLPGFSDSIEVQKENYRLYNFTTVTETGADPTLNPSLVERLREVCPADGDGSSRVELDFDSSENFDLSFYKNLRLGGGILESDQMLWNDASTRPIIQHYLSLRGLVGRSSFKVEFGRSMVKMSNAQVKTGLLGEIRRVCSKVNN
ncbi:peroxidase N1-like [Cucumis melo var. makuwa]|uniref:Peroxidase n=1 Tax=Cucumis melo var. makuwa TaxID=1194695 RepID=A0A5D3C9E8_CUCMM|nr:peroxidase N1-like [Cucumis melo var. makuwa]TYK06946.1 peroxidase N1-like [Cucumis melo var. makuwa]